MRNQLLAWQWQGYSEVHRDRRNLALHLVTMPVFIGGLATLITGATGAHWRLALAGLAGMLVALVAQGRGHKLEVNPPQPILGPGDLISRFFAEQLITFPRYVLTGGWARAWRAAGEAASADRSR